MKRFENILAPMDQERFKASTDPMFKGSVICTKISCLDCPQNCTNTDPELVMEQIAKWAEEEV